MNGGSMFRLGLPGAILLSLITATPGFAHLYGGKPYCPSYAPNSTWFQFVYGAYGPSVFGIKLDHLHQTVGTISGQRCYTMSGNDRGEWTLAGYNNAADGTDVETRHGTVWTYTMSLWGWQVRFNEAGEIFDNQHGLGRVGTLVCDFGSDC